MKRHILCAFLFSKLAVAQDFTVDSGGKKSTSGGAHSLPDWILRGSKGQVLRQGPHCKCNEDGELIGFNCSSKYRCELNHEGAAILPAEEIGKCLQATKGEYKWVDCPKGNR